MNNRYPYYINRSTIIGALFVALVLLGITIFMTGWAAPRQSVDYGFEINYLTMIPAPTHTPNATPTFTPDPLIYGTATLIPNTFGVGAYVQISGTDGEGLNIRSAPGLTADPVFFGYDEEVFVVRNGPQEADGYTWWYLVAPYDDSRAGWAASNFLALIPNP
jgi:hypothetical protein